MPTTRRAFLLTSAGALTPISAKAQKKPKPQPQKWMPKISENLNNVEADTLRWLKQLGCKHVIFQGTDGVDGDRKGYWNGEDVRRAKKNCEKAGLVLDSSGITFCQGTIAEMGVNVLDEIRHFGRLGKIFLVHFRFVQGKVPRYTEVFIDEGDLDPLQAMRTYKEVGYTGPFVSDHTPRVEGDTTWGHRGRTFSLGFMRALVHAVNSSC